MLKLKGIKPRWRPNKMTLTATLSSELIRVQDLKKYYPLRKGLLRGVAAWIQALDGVSFSIRKGECLGMVGESGCGKSTVARTMLRLVEPTAGQVFYNGKDIMQLKPAELKSMRRRLQIIFQDPFSSLDPRLPIGESVIEGLEIHGVGSPKERYEMMIDTLRKVGLEDYHARRYPHEFSGGQRQRVGIARALALNPDFVICDEPVSALDVSIQSQILNILKDLQQQNNLTYLFIAHNLSVVEHISDRVAVMYLGKMVELADRETLYRNPHHPYTHALLSAIPMPVPGIRKKRIILPGDVPSALNPPSGCRFHPRCMHATDICSQQEPAFTALEPEHFSACWNPIVS
jgi:oligopeptide/dipeptide ABC transporter ATP-binding protein